MFFACNKTLYFDGVYFESNNVNYNYTDRNEAIKIIYSSKTSLYLEELRSKYPLDEIVNENETDTEKILKILNWTNSRWKHNGKNSPKANDAISILKEAEEGRQLIL